VPEGTASRSLSAAPIEDSSAENSVTEAAAVQAAALDEPLFAAASANGAAEPPTASETIPSEEVTSSTAQESHV